MTDPEEAPSQTAPSVSGPPAPSAVATELKFHPGAEDRLTELTVSYYRDVGKIADHQAVQDKSNEIQTGHVERAAREYERRQRQHMVWRRRLRTGLQVGGSLMAGAGIGVLTTTFTATISASTVPIVLAIGGTIMTVAGVMMED